MWWQSLLMVIHDDMFANSNLCKLEIHFSPQEMKSSPVLTHVPRQLKQMDSSRFLEPCCRLPANFPVITLQVVNQLWTSATRGEWRLWSGCVPVGALRKLAWTTAEEAECEAVEQSSSTQTEREHLSRLTSTTVYLPYVVILPGLCRSLVHITITNFLTHLLLLFSLILFFSLI